ncbi:hypothetical protein AYM40_06220 [Paraburkholderia phytofirmans OLGA172]|uniref:Uncharacterized protein n=1 Tax=Paraburkholderia phytofirmans OLGA172 TaxID=1417228 RepID=A0A160FIE3_9BURK|nr:hypothetical protein [Paraburkholderia phytofirmans]ANB72010.1 hypothetical protein AYM40_06220 [Paraburkholderia phytofirmans OLGA172]
MSNPNKLLPLVKQYIHFDTLYGQAKQAIETYGGRSWTDTGEHDPGVTFMEGYCYSASDLAYRSTLPLTDLLTPPSADQIAGGGIFPADFGPQMTLTSGPITPEDYRRALLDLYDTTGQYFYFRNAQLVVDPDDYTYWYDSGEKEFSFVKPTSTESSAPVEFKLRGNYTLYVEPTRSALQAQTAAKAALNAFLADNRNIGESVSNVVWTSPQQINPLALIELDENVQNFAAIFAAIYEATEKFISPSAMRYSAAALIAQGERPDAIYQGPYMTNGWIPVLPETVDYTKPVTVNLGGLAQVWLAIDGVKSIVSLREWSNAANTWSWTSQNNSTYPQLWGPDPLTEIVQSVQLITIGGEYVTAAKGDIEAEMSADPVIRDPDVILPYGRYRDVAQYHPATDSIPPCYGLQQLPPGGAQPPLYQFLLPFEQMMANGCRQLAMLPQLLTFRRNGYTVWGGQWPYAPGSPADKVHESYSSALKTQIAANADDYDQELAILNYLLTYFGTQRAAQMLDTTADEFLAVEQNYLGNISELAYHRDNIRPDEVSALQKRIASRLGFGIDLFDNPVDLSRLPFYLIEHRALLPVRPSSQYDAPNYPAGVTLSDDQSTLTVVLDPATSVSELLVGQLIDLVLVGGLAEPKENGDYTLTALIVGAIDVEGNSFSLYLQDNPELVLNMGRIVDAQNAKKLYWKNCQAWLQDIDYPLMYAADQDGVPADERVLAISGKFPFPAILRVGDTLVVNAIEDPVATGAGVSAWELPVTVKAIDGVAGTVTVVKADGAEHDFPVGTDVRNYFWYAGSSFDRFSFIVSLVLNKAILPQQGDAYTTERWIRQCVQAEIPACVSVVIHWLDDVNVNPSSPVSFQNFSRSYSSWQAGKTAPSTATYQLLWQLSLGLLPTRLIGIGTMVIASSDQRSQVIGPDGTDWNVDVIAKNSLFLVPKKYVPS